MPQFNNLLRLLVMFASLSQFSLRIALAQDTTETNCVDASIVKFLKLNRFSVTEEQIQKVVIDLGLPLNTTKRTISEAIAILNSFGLRCVAFRGESGGDERWIENSIILFPVPNIGGHCVTSINRGEVRYIFDPRDNQIHQLTASQWRELGAIVTICSSSDYRLMKAKVLGTWFLLGTLIGICVTLLSLALSGIRTRYLPFSNIFLFLFLVCGCTNPKTDQKQLVIDLGTVSEGGYQSTEFTVCFSKQTKITRFSASCGCVDVPHELIGLTINVNENLRIPVKINMSNKSGEFIEQVQLSWEQQDLKSFTNLVVKGFAIKRCELYPKEIRLGGIPGGTQREVVEIVAHHPFKEPPKLRGIEIKDSSNFLLGLKWHVLSLENISTRPGSGTVLMKVGIDYWISELSEPNQTEEIKLLVSWDQPVMDNEFTCHVCVAPPLRFVNQEEWFRIDPVQEMNFCIPILVGDSLVAKSHFSATCSSPNVDASLDIENSCVNLRVTESSAVPLLCKVGLALDGEIYNSILIAIE